MSQVPNSYPYWLGTAPTSATAVINGATVSLIPTLLSGTTIVTKATWNGDGTTYYNFFTSPLLPAGTYAVSVDFYAYANGTAWNDGDAIACRIIANSDTALTYIYPSNFTRPHNNGFSTANPYHSGTGSASCAGVVVLRTDGYIYYQGVVFNTSGTNTHSVSMEQATYQKIA